MIEDFSTFKVNLRNVLNGDLPGHLAHSKVMAHRKSMVEETKSLKTAKQSAVLSLIYPLNNELHTVFILRPTYQGVHSAQIGFPGGKVEEDDKNFQDTALREAKEELNIDRSNLELLGQLTPLYVPPSNFIIYPFVAFQANRPDFIPESREVSEILEHPISHLLNNDALVDTKIRTANGNLKVKGFQIKNYTLWGATAMITMELIEMIREANNSLR